MRKSSNTVVRPNLPINAIPTQKRAVAPLSTSLGTKKAPPSASELNDILCRTRDLAIRYYELTGRPLGVTGEVAECEAARLLNLELSAVREAGYDAIRLKSGRRQKIQIKGRCVLNNNPGQRVGSIDTKKPWDLVMLVLLDRSYEPTEIYEAPRKKVIEALERPGSKARNERGSMSISQFKSIAKQVWAR